MIPKSVQIIKGGMGHIIKGQSGQWFGTPPPKREKDDIQGFSRASRRRLRETLALAQLNSSGITYGVTLTIPSPTDSDILSPDSVRELWRVLSQHRFPRLFPSSSLVWRIELQTRKQAHWHCVWYLSDLDAQKLAPTVEIETARQVAVGYMISLWQELVFECVDTHNWTFKTLQGFTTHSVQVQALTSTAIVGYLCDHESKHKQDQIGWVGRQWGVIGRKNLDFEGEVIGEVTQAQHLAAARQYRRLQEHLRREGKYTSVSVSLWHGNINKAIFGKDTERLFKCYDMVTQQS